MYVEELSKNCKGNVKERAVQLGRNTYAMSFARGKRR